MIASDELAALMRGGAPHALLDLRERGAYEKGHIFRATSLPRRQLEFRLPAMVTARTTPIVLCDEDGRLATRARPTLIAMGYQTVRVLAGGLKGWRAAGRPTVQGVNVPSKVFGERTLHELKTPHLTAAELARRIAAREDMVIVDARTPEEYARGCVPGAWNVPGGELVLRIGELVDRPETTIVVHCGGRTRSYIGAESLRRMRLPNPIFALENGTMGWELAGLELERGSARWVPTVSARSRAAAALAAQRVAAEDGVRSVSTEAVRRLLTRPDEQSACVLDVRTAEEYATGHVAGARWAPGGQLVQATDEYVAVRAAPIVLVCDDLVRSVMTAAWLGRMGLPDVAVLAGGLAAWERAGGEIESGHPAPLPFGYAEARAAVTAVAPGSLGDARVIDVDQSDVYRRGHVPGAVWLCRSRLESTIEGVASDRRGPLVMTCADGLHSMLAGATLARMGYASVRVLDGGTRAWERAGFALERGATWLGDEPDDVVLKPYEKGRAAMAAYLVWEEALNAEGQSPYALG